MCGAMGCRHVYPPGRGLRSPPRAINPACDSRLHVLDLILVKAGQEASEVLRLWSPRRGTVLVIRLALVERVAFE